MCGVRWARKVHLELNRYEIIRREEFEGKKEMGKVRTVNMMIRLCTVLEIGVVSREEKS